ncbi:nucleotidyltransferase family protein [soil metagenome]
MQRDEALTILAKHHDEIEELGVKSLALFGSVARNEAGPESDVDILVEFQDRFIGLVAFVRLQQYLETILSQPVDLVTHRSIKPQLRDRILGELVHAA